MKTYLPVYQLITNSCRNALLAGAFLSGTLLAQPSIEALRTPEASGTATSGAVTSDSGGSMVINVDNANEVFTWSQYDIGTNADVTYDATGASLNSFSALNIINDSKSSLIYGDIIAKTTGADTNNGNIYLLNPNGIIVGGGANFDLNDVIFIGGTASSDEQSNFTSDPSDPADSPDISFDIITGDNNSAIKLYSGNPVRVDGSVVIISGGSIQQEKGIEASDGIVSLVSSTGASILRSASGSVTAVDAAASNYSVMTTSDQAPVNPPSQTDQLGGSINSNSAVVFVSIVNGVVQLVQGGQDTQGAGTTIPTTIDAGLAELLSLIGATVPEDIDTSNVTNFIGASYAINNSADISASGDIVLNASNDGSTAYGIQNTASINSTDGSITLDAEAGDIQSSGNNSDLFANNGTLVVNGNDVVINTNVFNINANALRLEGSISGDLEATATYGGITDSGPLTISGDATFIDLANAGIILDTLQADGRVSIQGGNTSLINSTGLNLDGQIVGTLDAIATTGGITDSLVGLTVSGALSADTSGDNSDIQLVNLGGDITLGSMDAGTGDITLVTSGSLTQDGSNQVTGSLLTASASGDGGITLSTDVDSLDLSAQGMGDITITEQDGVELLDVDTELGTVSVTSNAGTVTLTEVDSGGLIKIDAVGDITAVEVLSTGFGIEAGIELTSTGGTIISSGTALTTASDQTVILNSSTALALEGTFAGGLDVTATNGRITDSAALAVSGMLNADTSSGNSDILLDNLQNDISLGTIDAGTGEVTLIATGDLTQAASDLVSASLLTASASGDGGLTLFTDVSSLNLSTQGLGSISLTEADAISLEEVSTEGGTVTIDSGGDITLAGSLNAGSGDVTLITTGAMTAQSISDLITGGLLTLEAGMDDAITLFTEVDSLDVSAQGTGGIDITEESSVTLNSVNSESGMIRVSATGDITAVAVNSTGAGVQLNSNEGTIISSGTALMIDSGQVVALNSHQPLVLEGTFSGPLSVAVMVDGVTDSDALSVGGRLDITTSNSNGDIVLDDLQGDIIHGVIKVGSGDVTLITTGNITQNSSNLISASVLTSSTGGDTGMVLGTDVNSLNLSALGSGSIDISENDGVTIDTVSTQGGSIDISAGGAISLGNINAGTGEVTLDTPGNIIQNETDLIIGSVLTGSTGGSEGISLFTQVDSLVLETQGTGAIDISEQDSISLTDVDSAATIKVIAGGDITAVDVNSTGSNIELTSTGGTIISSGTALTTTSSNSVVLTSSKALVLEGSFAGHLDVEAATGGLADSGALSVQGSLNIDTTGDNSDILLDELQGDITQGTINAGVGNITLVTTGDLTHNGTDLITGSVLTIDGSIDKNISLKTDVGSLNLSALGLGAINITEENAITLDSVTAVEGEINITAGGDITAVDVDSTGSGMDAGIELTSTGGTIISQFTALTTDPSKTVVLNSNQALTLEGIFEGNLETTATEGGITDSDYLIVSGDVTLIDTADEGITLDTLKADSKVIVEGGNTTLVNDEQLNLEGSINGFLDAMAINGGIADSGNLSVSGVLSANSSNDGSDIQLDDLQGDVTHGTIDAGVGQVTLMATGHITQSSDTLNTIIASLLTIEVAVDKNLTLRTDVDNADLSVSGMGTIKVTESDTISLDTVSSVDGKIEITAGGDITAVDVDSTSSDIELTSTGGTIISSGTAVTTATDKQVTLNSNQALALEGTFAGNLEATATTGGITDSDDLIVVGNASFIDIEDAGIVLDTLQADAKVIIDGGDTTLVNDTALSLEGLVEGVLNATATTGGITDSGNLMIVGNASFTDTADAGIVLNTLRADANVIIDGGNTMIINDSALNLEGLVEGTLNVTAAAGGITDSGNLAVTGDASFIDKANAGIVLDTLQADAKVIVEGWDTTLVNDTALSLEGLISGDLDATATTGSITDSGLLKVDGDATFTANSGITLDNFQIQGIISVNGGNSLLTHNGALTIAGDLTTLQLDSVTGVTQYSAIGVDKGSLKTDQLLINASGNAPITLDNVDNEIKQLTINTAVADVEVHNASNLILDALDASSFKLSNRGDVSLNGTLSAGSVFMEVDGDVVSANNAVIVSDSSLVISALGSIGKDHQAPLMLQSVERPMIYTAAGNLPYLLPVNGSPAPLVYNFVNNGPLTSVISLIATERPVVAGNFYGLVDSINSGATSRTIITDSVLLDLDIVLCILKTGILLPNDFDERLARDKKPEVEFIRLSSL